MQNFKHARPAIVCVLVAAGLFGQHAGTPASPGPATGITEERLHNIESALARIETVLARQRIQEVRSAAAELEDELLQIEDGRRETDPQNWQEVKRLAERDAVVRQQLADQQNELAFAEKELSKLRLCY